MVDHFAALDLPRRAALTSDAVRAAFQRRGAASHPDRSSDDGHRAELAGNFTALNEAQATLSSTPRRLQHLLELLTGERPRGGILPEPVMALFTKIGAAIQAADALISRRESSHSTLAKALLASESMAVQEQLEDLAGVVQQEMGALEANLAKMDALLAANDPGGVAGLATAANSAAFLQRWEGQIQSRRLRLLD